MDNTANRISESDTQAETKARRGLGPLALLVLVVILGIAGIFGLALSSRNQGRPTSGPAPDFSLSTFDGETYTLSQLRGKVVMVNFWAGWCAPCQDEAPALEATWQKYKDKGVLFLGVAYTDTERSAKAFLQKYGITYPTGLDIGTRISTLYRITGIPETFIVNRAGNVVSFVPAPLDEARLSSMLDQALATD
jgi:cytochrome c biogenesis protein CcmG/thiol:disulfide interchange protein DsbE